MSHSRCIAWIAAGAIVALTPRPTALHAAGGGDPPQLTVIDEVIMYGIDADTYELLRYNFDTDEFIRIGVVTDQNGNVVTDVEGLAMIPHGPHKGLYGTANFYDPTVTMRILDQLPGVLAAADVHAVTEIVGTLRLEEKDQ